MEQPEKPRLDQTYNADGKLNDVHQVKVAMTNASLFAYVADGQEWPAHSATDFARDDAEYAGFSPRPQPELIATFKTKGEALGVSKGLDRDRAVDESGNQIAVFGRRGARPFTFEEMQRMLRTNGGKGEYFSVSDEPATEPRRLSSNATSTCRPQLVALGLCGLVIGLGRKRRQTEPDADLASHVLKALLFD